MFIVKRFGVLFLFSFYVYLKHWLGLVCLVSLEMAVIVAHLTLFCLAVPFIE